MWTKILKETESRMQKTIDATTREFATVRTGRASAALVDGIKVLYYGTQTPLQQLASISIPEPRLIVIQPWDASSVKEIEKAVLSSDLGLQPTVDGKLIRISIPPLSKERRENMVKVVKKMSEDAKIILRNTRREGNDQIKKIEKEKQITEDESFKATEEIQKLTDRYSKRIEELTGFKEKELITV